MAEFDDTGLFTGDSEGDEKDFLLSVATAMSHTLEVGTFSRSKLGIGQRFAGVFRGKAAVDWLIGRNYALGREDALQLGTALIKAGWIMHCRKPGERLKDKSTSLYKFTDELRSAIDQKAADARRHVVLSSSKHLVHSFETPVRTPVASTRPSELEVPHAIESVDVDLATERQQDGADAAQGEIGPEPLSFPGPIPQLIDHTQDFEEIRTKLVQVRLSMHSTSVSIRRLERNTLTLSPHEQAVVSAALAGVSLLFHALGVSDPSLAKKVATWLHRLKWFPRMRLEKSLHAVVVLCRAVVVATSLFLLMESCLLMFMFGLGQASVTDVFGSVFRSGIVLFAFGSWYHKTGHHALRHLSGSSPSTTSSYSGYESEDADRSESNGDVPDPAGQMVDVTPVRNGATHAHRRHVRNAGK